MVDIIITCYNRQKYIAQAIESVLAQTYSNYNLLICDDGSTDNSLSIAQSYTSDRVKVISNSRQGFTTTLKNAIDATNNQYLAWVDSDDYLAPNCLEETVSILENNPSYGMAYTQYLEIDSLGKSLGLGHRCRKNYSQKTLLQFFITFHFRLIRRSIYQSVGGINANYKTACDYDLCLRLSEVTDIYQLKKPLYYYRKHCNQISRVQAYAQNESAKKAVNAAIIRRKLC